MIERQGTVQRHCDDNLLPPNYNGPWDLQYLLFKTASEKLLIRPVPGSKIQPTANLYISAIHKLANDGQIRAAFTVGQTYPVQICEDLDVCDPKRLSWCYVCAVISIYILRLVCRG